MNVYLELLWGFLKVGFFSFGGAYSAIPLIRDVVRTYGWMDDEALSYVIAVSESTPGPLMVNLATYVGSVRGGILGALLATFAVVLPAFLIILLLMFALSTALSNRYVAGAMDGLKPCVAGLILATGAYMALTHCFDFSAVSFTGWQAPVLTAVLALVYFGSRLVRKKKMSPILLIAVAAVLGIAAYAV